MKSTGIVRRVDELGRIVIPKETREILYIAEGNSLEVFLDADETKNSIILKRYAPGCVFCGQPEGTTSFRGKAVCDECIREAKRAL